LDGTLEFVHPLPDVGLELGLVSGAKHFSVRVQNAAGTSPSIYSRLRIENRGIQLLTGATVSLALNVSDLRRIGAAGQHARCVADLKGQILAASDNRKFLAFKDDTGVMLLAIPPPEKALAVGQIIHIQGNCMVEGARAIFRDFPLVDNDDIHAMTEIAGVAFLTAGRHALRLDWFNHEYPYGLEVYYQGPGLPRQRIPGSALFYQRSNLTWAHGLNYRCYEGSWLRIPDFDRLLPAKEGIVTNFDTAVITRTDEVGLEFKGYIDVPREGLYTFTTISDDGSLLFLDEKKPVIDTTGTSAPPERAPISAGQPLRGGDEIGWSRAEGTVTFASEKSGQLNVDLSSDTGRMRVEVADDTGVSLPLLPGRRVRVTGIYMATRTADGQIVAGTLLTPGICQLEFWEPEAQRWSDRPSDSDGVATTKSSQISTNLPTLTTVEQIKRLTRKQWQRGYPVNIRGIVTSILQGGFFIQDFTWSIYARWQAPTDSDTPRIGDYWEIEGKTFAEFAPNIQVSHAVRLGAGALPDPLRPTWDQLINGSLDTEYVELQGIVVSVNCDEATLLTRAGKLGLELPDLQPQALQQYDNALIRLRGCVIPVRDIHTQQVEPGRIRLSSASITVDEAAPRDPFATPLKHASDLLLFDWRAGAFQRVKIAGQILHKQDGEYFLADGNDGLRFITKDPVELQPGDLVEAVGFLELGGNSPVLREAIARRTGTAKLPEARMLDPQSLLSRRYDATLVKVRARLIEISHDPTDDTLEMRSDTRGFVARLRRSDGPLPRLLPGSLLEMTGVYEGQGSDPASGQEVTSFELLLNSGGDIKTLDSPSWWTVRRALTVAGAMVLLIVVALIWIALLRQRIEERSQQLAAEIRDHEHTERRRELEEERSRIAHDLHDDLGAALTQIRFLSALESRDSRAPEDARGRMWQISEKSRDMVASLDEIVWAINPTNDSLASLANYLCHFAEEFFSPTAIRCRLDVADALPSAPLTSEVRHHLYLAVREALNNIAKHSEATEVWLRIHVQEPELRIELEDNGRGFTPAAAASAGEGLASMRQRLEKIGGRYECESRPGKGAACRFVLQLKSTAFENGKGWKE
jgi:signal transduction histidine kinase